MRRSFSLGLMLSSFFVLPASLANAQNYEYSTTLQRNLSQIRVNQTLHSNLSAYIANSANAKNVGIAILDGVADATHSDLKDRLSIYSVYNGTYVADQHGTHVAGIAGASQNGTGIVGVAPTAKLLSIPVFDSKGWVASDLGKRALDTAQTNGAKVVNMSYGPSARGDVFLNGELNLFDDYRNSMVLVRAAGNSGTNVGNEYYAGKASVDLAHLLIVGSVDSDNRISSFSNKPGTACIGSSSRCTASERMSNFFIVAPGRSIYSDLPGGYGYMSGTSMAAPHVAGAAALVFQNAYAGNTYLTPAQVADILKKSATDLGTKGVDSVFGWGLLNVEKALGPVGSTSIATSSTVDGSTTTTTDSKFTKSSTLGRSSAMENLMDGMVIFDAYGRGFVLNDVTLAASPSTLAEESVSSLAASLLMHREVHESGGWQTSFFQNSDGIAGFNGFSFSSEGLSLSSVAGNTAAYFGQMPDPLDDNFSNRLGTNFFTGAGDVGQSFTTGFFSGADLSLTPSLTLSALYAHGSEQALNTKSDWTDALDQTNSTSGLFTLGAALAMGDQGTIGFSLALLSEEDAMLGIQNEGAISLGERAYTQMAGLSYSRELTDKLRFDAFAQLGLTGTNGADDTIFSSVSDVWSTKMGLSLTGTGLLQENDRFQLSLVSPWRIVEGDVEAKIAVGREFDGTVNYETRRASLTNDDIPLDLGLSYMMRAGDVSYGASLWLRDSDVESLSLNEAVASAGLSWAF
jgi:hypothetical protein